MSENWKRRLSIKIQLCKHTLFFWDVYVLPSSGLQLKGESMKADVEAPRPAGQEDSAIRCRDVCRAYGKLKVLTNLNLTVPQGQM